MDSADVNMAGTTSNESAGEDKASAVPGFRVGQSAGKKELPPGIRARFTEVFVDEVCSREDVGRIVRGYLERYFPSPPVDAIVKFYAWVKQLTHECALLDGAGKVAHFSLRNLTRALRFSINAVRRPCHPSTGNVALAQGLAVGFATPLNRSSAKRIEALIEEAIGVSAGARGPAVAQPTPSSAPVKKASNTKDEMANVQLDKEKGYVNVEGYWIKAGPGEIDLAAAHKDFVITTSVRHHLQNIARMLSGGRYPVLLEGPTSSGKTSLVKFVAKLTGHECVRINNHEHTDLQEYLGQYVCDPATGQLVFQEGVLARAARAGHWVVLDELNLAPSEVLEALNRLLDDNRELFIADTGETIKPHEDFMVLATQNPAGGLYGGRKLLSRAFRNRFTEGFIDELPMQELAVVLHKRCAVPPSYVKTMLAVYSDLQTHRSQTNVFQGKQSFMTVRDLLRWGNRKPGSHEDLAVEGYALLAERLRKEEDRQVVMSSIKKHCAGAKTLRIDYTTDPFVLDIRERIAARLQAGDTPPSGVKDVVWTPAFCRMCALIGRCVRAGESALLIGETGGGKTMACQVLSWVLVEEGDPSRQLRIVNCHQQTETSDFIGSLRPVRGREQLLAAMYTIAGALLGKLDLVEPGEEHNNEEASERLEKLKDQLKSMTTDSGNPKSLIALL
jgi:midasin